MAMLALELECLLALHNTAVVHREHLAFKHGGQLLCLVLVKVEICHVSLLTATTGGGLLGTGTQVTQQGLLQGVLS